VPLPLGSWDSYLVRINDDSTERKMAYSGIILIPFSRRAGSSVCNARDLYSGGVQLEPCPGPHLFWLRFSMGFTAFVQAYTGRVRWLVHNRFRPNSFKTLSFTVPFEATSAYSEKWQRRQIMDTIYFTTPATVPTLRGRRAQRYNDKEPKDNFLDKFRPTEVL
jgi:hypothetical protein